MTVKEYLCQYHNLLVQIEKKKGYIAFCNERSNMIPGPSYDERIGSDPNRKLEAPFIHWINKKLEAEKQLEELEEKAINVKVDIETVILMVENTDYQKVLTYRYIDWLAWDEIAAKVYISERTARRWHKDAIESIKI